MNDKELGKYILDKLRIQHGRINLEEFIAPGIKDKSLYEFIIGVLLSQNTSDRNAIRAYNKLRNICGGEITPKKILKLGVDAIAEAIRIAGMHYQRARRIVELAKIFIDEKRITELVERIKRSSIEEARRILLSLPGIGSKTADVVLLMYFNKPTFPVDTHIRRITKRLGFIVRDNYENVRSFWMKILDPSDYLEAHLLLITHGRRICKARNPFCDKCLLKDICKYNRVGMSG